MTGKVIGGLIGFFFLGPIGAIAGIFLGHKYDKSQAFKPRESYNEIPYSEVPNQKAVDCPHCKKEVYVSQEGLWNCPFCNRDFTYGNSPQQVEGDFFLTTVFSMFAKLAKADGIVTKDEIEVVDQYAREVFQLDFETRKQVSRIFNEAKNNNRTFEDYARDYYQAYRSDYSSLVSIIEGFLFVSSIKTGLQPSRERLILKAVEIFKVDQREYQRIKAKYFTDNDKYYSVLGCCKTDSMEEIKRKYRKLVSEYHPDKIMAKDLPEDFIKFANDRFKEIQEAYEVVKKEKQAS